ncbi:MAG: hypothetical protein HMLKMBBP_00082 [Planctomycetes bacterium]|nr:hypothetical protein [Planctomycetota bacterium]
MSPVHVDAVVRLLADDPESGLRRGAEGVVTGVCLSDVGLLCEVEFPGAAESPAVRALLRAEQLKAIREWGHR